MERLLYQKKARSGLPFCGIFYHLPRAATTKYLVAVWERSVGKWASVTYVKMSSRVKGDERESESK